jgi:hypothetical protein
MEEDVATFLRNSFLTIADCGLRIADSEVNFYLRIRNP